MSGRIAGRQESLGRCRICRSSAARYVATYRPYLDYRVDVFDCRACGCRFVEHDPDAHEKLHANPSTYSQHARYCEEVRKRFAAGERGALRRYLAAGTANRFVMEFIDLKPEVEKVAEIGCSLGYLLSYFISTGRESYGFDVASTAVRGATKAFGPHFHLVNDGSLKEHAPYDAIFHVGTIGCVSDPIGMTEGLLDLLRPGGWLLFNAPNRKFLEQSGELWLGTPPPDLVSIFPAEFWQTRFKASARAHVDVRHSSLYEALLTRLRQRSSAVDSKRMLGGDTPADSGNTAVRKRRLDSLVKATARTILGPFRADLVDPYGVMVSMQRSSFE